MIGDARVSRAAWRSRDARERCIHAMWNELKRLPTRTSRDASVTRNARVLCVLGLRHLCWFLIEKKPFGFFMVYTKIFQEKRLRPYSRPWPDLHVLDSRSLLEILGTKLRTWFSVGACDLYFHNRCSQWISKFADSGFVQRRQFKGPRCLPCLQPFLSHRNTLTVIS